MRTARCVFLLRSLPAILLLFMSAGVVLADRLPEDGTATLEEVLSRPEFASSSKELSSWERFKQKIMAEIGQFLKSVFDSVDLPDFKVSEVSWISSVLDGIVGALEFLGSIVSYLFSIGPALLFAVIGGLGSYALYRVYRSRRGKVHWRDGDYAADTDPDPRLSLTELLKNRDYIAMLEELRRRFREQYLEKYALPLSMTDRCVLRELPKDAENYALFVNTVELFEAIAFAEKDLDEGRVVALAEQVSAV